MMIASMAGELKMIDIMILSMASEASLIDDFDGRVRQR
jgi:hypothetical protein